MDICNEVMVSPLLPPQDRELLWHYATDLYNSCRTAYNNAAANHWNERKRAIALLRFEACLLLHGSALNGLKETHPSKDLVGMTPDVLHAYEYTASNLKECCCEEEYKQCFVNAIQIIYQMESVLSQTNVGASFYTFKEAEYDVLMAWTTAQLPTSPDDQSLVILKKIRDDCVRYLPDLKLSFVTEVSLLDYS